MSGKRWAARGVIALMLVVLLAGCGGKVSLGLKLKPGDKHVLEVTNDFKVNVKVMGQEQNQTDNSVTRYTYSVKDVDAAGLITADVTFNASNLMGGVGGQMFDQMGGSEGLGLGEITLNTTIAADGTVQSVKGMEEVANKVAEKVKEQMKTAMASNSAQAGLPPGLAGQMDTMMNGVVDGVKQMISNDSAKQQLQRFTDLYPAAPVGKGSTWKKQFSVSMPLPMKADETYTVTARGGGVVNLAYEAVISANQGGINMGMGKLTADLKGTQKGVIQVEEATGWVRAATIDLTIEGKVDMGPMSMPLSMNGKYYIKGYPG